MHIYPHQSTRVEVDWSRNLSKFRSNPLQHIWIMIDTCASKQVSLVTTLLPPFRNITWPFGQASLCQLHFFPIKLHHYYNRATTQLNTETTSPSILNYRFFRYIVFALYLNIVYIVHGITKNYVYKKPKHLINWDRGNSCYCLPPFLWKKKM